MNSPLSEAIVEEPRLQNPGTGLPIMESRFFRHGLPLLTRAISHSAARKMFLREGNRILYLAQDLKDWELEERVLVKRPFGIEDSSRYWSMEMLMEHLIITGVAAHKNMRTLASGSKPSRNPRIADGKPSGGRGPQIRDEFSRFLNKFVESSDALTYNVRPTLAHPWTGEMNTLQWFKFTAVHNWIHRVHAERIVEGIF